MSIQSDNPLEPGEGRGFEFPGVFEITAMGPAGSGLEADILRLLEEAGIEVLRETVALRDSSGGKYVSVRLSFKAESRQQYDAAHEALRSHPEVKWTI